MTKMAIKQRMDQERKALSERQYFKCPCSYRKQFKPNYICWGSRCHKSASRYTNEDDE